MNEQTVEIIVRIDKEFPESHALEQINEELLNFSRIRHSDLKKTVFKHLIIEKLKDASPDHN